MEKNEYYKLKNDKLFLNAHTMEDFKDFRRWSEWEMKNKEYELKIRLIESAQ